MMTEQEREAYRAGVADKMHGFSRAITTCREAAKKGSKECAAYVRGYEGSGVGE